MGIYAFQGFNFTWVSEFSSTMNSVSALQFERLTISTGLLVLFKTPVVTIVVLDAFTGAFKARLTAPTLKIGAT